MTCVTHFHYFRGPDVKGSNGPPAPCLECKLVDPKTGKECNVGEEGEVWIRGPSVFMRYLDNPEATAEAKTPDGWYRTGDIGLCDELGFLVVVDRLKELLKVGYLLFVGGIPHRGALLTFLSYPPSRCLAFRSRQASWKLS